MRINLHRHPIYLAFDAGDLVLSGEAETVAAKKLALQTASQIHGPRRVIDRLRVKPSDRLGDAEIRDHFSKLLLGSRNRRWNDVRLEPRLPGRLTRFVKSQVNLASRSYLKSSTV